MYVVIYMKSKLNRLVSLQRGMILIFYENRMKQIVKLCNLHLSNYI